MDIDINVDMGEGFGMYSMGSDEAFMPWISSANVACGFHAGDPTVMKKTVAMAAKHGVQVGAHPGLPDLQGFGRREINVSVEEIHDDLLYQVGALKAFCEAKGLRLHHVKPHGSLYGMAARRAEVAEAICAAICSVDKGLYFYTMKTGVAGEVAEKMGLRVVYELYGDLDYDSGGNLVITRHHEAYHPGEVAGKVLKMVKEKRVRSLDGKEIPIEGSSVCLHSDSPGATDLLIAVRRKLEEAGCRIASPAL